MGLFETLLVWLVLAFTTWWGSGTPADTDTSTTSARVAAVIDGDTIDVMVGGRKERIRYIGIDTPEPYAHGAPECGSLEATAENKRLVAGKEVELVADQEDTDKYGRFLRYVYVDRVMVNESLVRDGFAKPLTIPPDTRYADRFEQLAAAAKHEKRGVWSCP